MSRELHFVLPVAPASVVAGPEDRAIAGAGGTLLTNEQRQRLARCGRRAYERQVELGLAEGEYDAWRRELIRKEWGVSGIRELRQREYGRVMARFIELAGDYCSQETGCNGVIKREEPGALGDRALPSCGGDGAPPSRGVRIYGSERRAAGKAPGRDDADRARWVLREECRELGWAFGGEAGARRYAEALLAKIHKTEWMSATARQLWQVIFTLRNRGRVKGSKMAVKGPLEKASAKGVESDGGCSRDFAGGCE